MAEERAELVMEDDDHDQDHAQPVASSTSDATVRDCERSMLAFRSVVFVLVSFVRSFSTNSRPALRAASGRPPARQRHDGHRGTGLTHHPAPNDASSLSRAVLTGRPTRSTLNTVAASPRRCTMVVLVWLGIALAITLVLVAA